MQERNMRSILSTVTSDPVCSSVYFFVALLMTFTGEGGDVSGDRDGAGAGRETSWPRQRRTQHEPSPGGASVSLSHTRSCLSVTSEGIIDIYSFPGDLT